MEEEFLVQSLPPIEGARKDINLDGGPYDPDDPEQCSEWAFAIALNRYKVGDFVAESELHQAIEEAKIQQVIDKLVDMGHMECVWDPESGEPAYVITDKGQEYVENNFLS